VELLGLVSEPHGDGKAGFLMEFCEGGSLCGAVKNKILGPTEKMFVMLGTASAMAHLHNLGICHRYLEPGHILLDSNRHPKICGFTFVQRFPSGDGDSELKPEGQYVAPEVLARGDDCDPFPADVYSYAMTMYSMLSGRPPYPLHKSSVNDRVMKGGRPNLRRLDAPVALRKLIEQCWDQGPSRRLRFDEIVKVLREPDCRLPGTDAERFQGYLLRLQGQFCLATAVGPSAKPLGRFNYALDADYGAVLARASENAAIHVDDARLFIEINGFLYFLDAGTSNTLRRFPGALDETIVRIIAEAEAPAIRCPPIWTPIMRDDVSFETTTRRLGFGGCGSVSLIKDSAGHELAYKEFYDVFLSDNKLVTRELSLLFKVQHPAIVRLYYIVRSRGLRERYGLVTEYCPNLSVDTTMAAHPLTDTQMMIIVLGIASAMAYLHKNRICHRDMKPKNILLDSNLHPKVADSGLAKQLGSTGDSRQWSHVGGTGLYMAPEIHNEQPNPNQLHCDIYGFGLTVYYILTGDRPFPELPAAMALGRLLNGERPALVDLNLLAGLAALLSTCWCHDPKQRPQFNEIVEVLRRPVEAKVLLPSASIDEYQTYAETLGVQVLIPSPGLPLLKVVVVGAGGVGKTSIVRRLVQGNYAERRSATMGADCYTYTQMIKGQIVRLQIWDTVGQERFRSIGRSYFRNAAGAMLVYDVPSMDSFEQLEGWLADLREHCLENAYVLVVGTKLDLVTDGRADRQSVYDFCLRHHLSPIETSALNGDGVNAAFRRLTHEVHKRITTGQVALPGAWNLDLGTNEPDLPAARHEGNCC
jgi:small GTP-binding protein